MRTPNLLELYHKLLNRFGPQRWWPGDSPFEVIIGAILTQQTAWKNVEKAILNLKKEKLLTVEGIANTDIDLLQKSVRPAGYYNQKSKRIKNVCQYLLKKYNANLDTFFDRDIKAIRNELLCLNGIGPETADSILLYAGNLPIFVVDAYTIRVCKRLGIKIGDDYEEVQRFFEKNMSKKEKSISEKVKLYNEYHALIVALGKNYCKNKKPLCDNCPLLGVCDYRRGIKHKKKRPQKVF